MKPSFFYRLIAVVAALVSLAAFSPAGSYARNSPDDKKHFVYRSLSDTEMSEMNPAEGLRLDSLYALVLYSDVEGVDFKIKKKFLAEQLPYDGEKYVLLLKPGKRADALLWLDIRKEGFADRSMRLSFKDGPVEAYWLDYVDTYPKFTGESPDAFSNWVATQLRYPQSALISKIEGVVVLQFAIDVTGEVTDISVIKGLSPDCDAEAVRVMALSPKWTPAMKGDKPVKLYYQFPVQFKISDGGEKE